jgi:hypothetical protein
MAGLGDNVPAVSLVGSCWLPMQAVLIDGLALLSVYAN